MILFYKLRPTLHLEKNQTGMIFSGLRSGYRLLPIWYRVVSVVYLWSQSWTYWFAETIRDFTLHFLRSKTFLFIFSRPPPFTWCLSSSIALFLLSSSLQTFLGIWTHSFLGYYSSSAYQKSPQYSGVSCQNFETAAAFCVAWTKSARLFLAKLI